jgi:hypothetical protein
MNPERKNASGICSELDGAFATVQAACLRREPGYGDAQNLARECVVATVANINRRVLQAALSPAETSVIEAKVQALIRAAARIPGPNVATAREDQPAKAALSGR